MRPGSQPRPDTTARWLVALAYVLGLVCLGMLASFLVLAPRGGEHLLEALGSGDWREEIPFVTEMALGGVLGALLAAHRPRHPVGWLMILLSMGFLSFDVVVSVGAAAPAPTLGVRLVAWLGNWVWVAGHLGAMLLLFLLPNGRALGPRWAILARTGVVLLAVIALLAALIPGPLEASPRIDNPFGLAPVASLEPVFGIALLGSLVIELLAAVSLVVRFVRARGTERQQLKWIAYGVVVLVAMQVGEQAGIVPRVLAPLGGLALTGALVLAVTRHRLFDIDRLISRTLTYAVVTGVLVAAYAVAVLALRPVVTPLTGGSDLAVAGSTLVVAALFGPVRRRVQAVVDHRFNRRQYDAGRAVEAFGQRLRDEVALGQLEAELRHTVGATLQPSTASLWVVPTARSAS